MAAATKPTVMSAKMTRPICPNHVNAATAASRARASGIRAEARPGTNWINAEAPAAALIEIVRTKSTIRAPIGMNAQPSPNALPAAAAAPPPSGKRATNWW